MAITYNFLLRMTILSERFWREKTLSEMSRSEWESLCDGCARCCLIKLQDEGTSKIYYTGVACRYLDQYTCSYKRYEDRTSLVPDCVQLSPARAVDYTWLPDTCAYRLVTESKDLPFWHHLVSGSKDTVHRAGISVRDKCLSEEHVHPEALEEQVIHWVGQSGTVDG